MERLSTVEVADRLRVSTAEVRRLVRLGRLHPQRPSSRVLLFDGAQVDGYAAHRPKAGWQKGRPRKPAPPAA